jgi:hypothetical protein
MPYEGLGPLIWDESESTKDGGIPLAFVNNEQRQTIDGNRELT